MNGVFQEEARDVLVVMRQDATAEQIRGVQAAIEQGLEVGVVRQARARNVHPPIMAADARWPQRRKILFNDSVRAWNNHREPHQMIPAVRSSPRRI